MTNNTEFKPGQWTKRLYGCSYSNSEKAIALDLITHYIWKDDVNSMFARHFVGMTELAAYLGYGHRTFKNGLERLERDEFLRVHTRPFSVELT